MLPSTTEQMTLASAARGQAGRLPSGHDKNHRLPAVRRLLALVPNEDRADFPTTKTRFGHQQRRCPTEAPLVLISFSFSVSAHSVTEEKLSSVAVLSSCVGS